MERHEILEAMTELKLYGMRASFDEIAPKQRAWLHTYRSRLPRQPGRERHHRRGA
jgi:hypothetical protein